MGTKLGRKGLESIKNYFYKAPPFKGYSTQPGITSTPSRILDKRKLANVAIPVAGIGGIAASKMLGTSSTPTPTPTPEIADETEQFATAGRTGSGQGNRGVDADEARRREARKRFRYIAAGKSSSERLDRERAYDLQEFDAKIQQDTLIAKQELNKINSASVLQNRLTQVNAEIAALQEQLYNSPTNAALRELEMEKQEAIKDGKDVSAIQEQIDLQRIASAEELERYADPMGTGDVGLLVQRRQLQARINELEQGLMNDPMDSIVARNT